MSNKNLNDFFDEELKKQEEENQRAQQRYQQPNQDPFGFDDGGYSQQKHQQMYQTIPEYNGQEKFLARKGKGKKALIVSLVAIGMVIVYFLGYFSFLLMNPDLKLISDVLSLVNQTALIIDESEDKYERDYAYQAAKAILESIDQYSTLLTPEEYYSLLYPQEISSVSNGLSYNLDDEGNYVIAEVEVGSPAYQKGVFAGDVVKRLDITDNMNGIANGSYPISSSTKLEDFQKYIHSQKMDITVEREGVSGQITILGVEQKDDYDGTSVEYYFGANDTNMSEAYLARLGTLPNDVGYIRLTGFMDPLTMDSGEGTGDFTVAMQKFKQAGKKKLIFDLNNNLGGRDDIASAVAAYLLYDKNNASGQNLTVCVDKDKDDNVIGSVTTNSVYQNYFDTNATKPQIAVLTNGRSASASELMVGALTDYGTAVQVGTTTHGKGIAQGVIQLRAADITVDGKTVTSYWAAYMTYVKFYTPVSDVCKHGVGFAPQQENIAQTFDQQIAKALQVLA